MGWFDGFLSVKWGDSSLMPNGTIQWILKCQMGRFNGFLSVKWGDSLLYAE